MTAQTSLFESIDVRFAQFHRDNPHVYEALVRLAREARAAGKNKIGVKALYERARWDLWLRTDRDADEPKLNNDFTSRYARLIRAQEPDLTAMFEIRKLRAA